MKVKEVRLFRYRNYRESRLSFGRGMQIFVGENAQGKTNLLEAIFLLATGRAYRSSREADLVMWGETSARVEGVVENALGETTVTITFAPDRRRQITLNGERVARLSDLYGVLTAVWFSPEQLSLVKGGPGERRRFLDTAITQVSPAYREALPRFYRTLQQRNAMLKAVQERRETAEAVEMWNGPLIELGARVMAKRRQAVAELGAWSARLHRDITGEAESIALAYVPGLDDDAGGELGDPALQATSSPDAGRTLSSGAAPPARKPEAADWEGVYRKGLEESLERLAGAEIARGRSLFGPQRDDIDIRLNGTDLRTFGSQGQQRTAALAMKMAELQWMREDAGEFPVLLLDDVFSELDDWRRERLLLTVPEGVQLFLTTTHLQALDPGLVSRGHVLQIRQGTASLI